MIQICYQQSICIKSICLGDKLKTANSTESFKKMFNNKPINTLNKIDNVAIFDHEQVSTRMIT